jgi:hypothetical protein
LRQVGFEIGADLLGVFAHVSALVVAIAEHPEQPNPPSLLEVYAGECSRGLADSCLPLGRSLAGAWSKRLEFRDVP